MAKPIFIKAGSREIKATRVYACDKCAIASTRELLQEICPSCKTGKIVKFDSKAEYRRWVALVTLYELGKIDNLKRQTPFKLNAEGGTLVGKFISDFDYTENGVYIVEDVKGKAQTEISMWKCRHFKAQYGFPVTLVRMN